jgi:hypothetical protein
LAIDPARAIATIPRRNLVSRRTSPDSVPDERSNLSSFLWSVADYKQLEYGKAILPLTVLRRSDCLLAAMRDLVARGRRNPEN